MSRPRGAVIPRPPTGSDVARVAGVSKSAVSRAFTGGVVSPEARERILAAATKLRYRPSLTARSLTTSRSMLVGLAITHLDNQFYPHVVELMSERFAQAGFRLVLFVTSGEADLDPVLDELLGYRLDGVVLASSSMAAHLAAECLDAGVPVMMFNNVDPQGIAPGVTADSSHGAALVARYLMAAGHNRFGIITGRTESSTSVDRSTAFAKTIVDAGHTAPLVECGRFEFEAAMTATRRLLSAADAPDAIFCVNDHMALAAVQATREAGRNPGIDVSIVGFDDATISGWSSFSLTTYAQPINVMIETTVVQLVAAMRGREPAAGIRQLPGRLIVRDSARKPAGVMIDTDGITIWRDDAAC